MVNMFKNEFTVLQHMILRFLFSNAGRTFNARGISIALEVSQPAVSKALPLLENKSIVTVKKDKESKRLEIELNRNNPTVIGLKRADNLSQLYESGLAEFLMEKFPGCTVIIFGSFSKGEDTYKSDIDIAIIGGKSKTLELKEFEKKLSREIRINHYASFKDIVKELRNNILGGIMLSGWVDL
jgi:predicted nucleotidyltransferase